jgi:copper oxidase (laccase) domain-containing protein
MSEELNFTPELVNNGVGYIENLNKKSWFMNSGESHPFVAMSITDVGLSRDSGVPRTELAGNMSSLYGDKSLPEDQRIQLENENVEKFLVSLDMDPERTTIIRPQASYDNGLNSICADDSLVDKNVNGTSRLKEPADFVYTFNPNTVLAIKPADCPIIVTNAETLEGKPILTMVHIPWRGAEAGHVENMLEKFKDLNIDPDSIRIYISGGARKESYPFTISKDDWENLKHKDLAVNRVENSDGSVSFGMDMQGLIRKTLNGAGIDDYQIFEDTSDTSRMDSGYSSHGRAIRSLKTDYPEVNTRSIFVATMENKGVIVSSHDVEA